MCSSSAATAASRAGSTSRRSDGSSPSACSSWVAISVRVPVNCPMAVSTCTRGIDPSAARDCASLSGTPASRPAADRNRSPSGAKPRASSV